MLFFIGFWSYKDKSQRKLLLLWICIPIITFYLTSLYFKHIYIHRVISYILPTYLMIIAYGILSLPKKIIGVIVFLIVILHTKLLDNYYQNNLYFSQETYRIGVPKRLKIKEAIHFIEENYGVDTVILHTCRNTLFPFHFKEPHFEQYIVRSGEVEKFFEVEKFYYGERIGSENMYPKNIREVAKRYDTLLLIFSDWEYSYERSSIAQDAVEVKQYLNMHYVCMRKKDFQDLTLFYYRKQ